MLERRDKVSMDPKVSAWAIDDQEALGSLVFCEEYTYENWRTAELLLMMAGSEQFDNVVEL